MTAPNLTAIVEAVARDRWHASRTPEGRGWDELTFRERLVVRESVRGIVTATLLALTPMVDDWVALAKDNADIGERAENLSEKASERGDYTEALARSADARVAYTAGNVLLACASKLRSLIEGAK